MTTRDTIFALSSGAGRSAVAVIRISGPSCATALSALTVALPCPREFALRMLRDPRTEEPLDKAIVAWLPGPASFTGEDCAELHVHGGPAVVAAVLDALAFLEGLRPAEAGEFTRRAFLNGKMDLVEAEGLADLLDAQTTSQRRQAFRQMSGQSSAVFASWRERLLSLRAMVEAAVDFSDEAGVAEAALSGIDQEIRALLQEMERTLERSSASEVIRQGARVVLAGRPNTGKSSLLNALAGRDAAIVSHIPGTTRDAIEVMLDLRGLPVIVTDTAGLRAEAVDLVEAEGMRRSLAHMADADLLVWVWSQDVADSESPEGGSRPALFIENKCDLADSGLSRNGTDSVSLRISTRTGDGISNLLLTVEGMLRGRLGNTESALIVSARQKAATRDSIRFLNDALALGEDLLEMKAEELRRAADEIGRLTGRIDVEEWLGAIFSRFCIGK